MTARDTVLAAIRAALADVPGDEPAKTVPRDYPRSHADADPVGVFAERVAEYRATVGRTADPATEIAGALARRDVRRPVVLTGFPVEWLAPEAPWTVLRDSPRLSVEALDNADAVLSTVAVAIAVTGTLVLDAGPGQGRRALTLLPDYQLCVVRAGQIARDVPEALDRLDPTAPLTFVSGPSATSDIELDRVEGVHGPRTLDVVIVDAGKQAKSRSARTSAASG
ncbi:lactate utilization protein C [Streptomyces sp. NPDC020801]|uniref:LutC/YkgG family protein n=1 Tax=unclassified Streptomyces TaxID=2593676 RepID=UPI0037A90776